MQDGFPYIDILIFGVIAVFLIFRLKNILGTKTGFEESNTNKKKHVKQFANVVPIKKSQNNSYIDKIDKIKKVDQTFDMNDFLDGSKNFFSMVLESFVSGNLESIKNFVKPSVLKSFNAAVEDRNKENETLIINLKSIEKNEIISTIVTKTSIKINVLFESFQIRALIDKNDQVIDGNTEKEIIVKDEWVFERKINNDNPNWTLIETKSY